jgi:hypothetical protein
MLAPCFGIFVIFSRECLAPVLRGRWRLVKYLSFETGVGGHELHGVNRDEGRIGE